jgi:ribosomal-protein-alanine N-acetyltransferase
MEFEELHTKRLRLRKLTPEIYDHIFGTFNDAEIMAFFNLDSQEAVQKEKDKHKKGYTTHRITFNLFQLIDKETGIVMGTCGLHNWYPEHNRAEIGYMINSDSYKQKGFMTEAVAALLDYGFNTVGLRRIEALVSPGNIPSIRILESYGFTKEGLLREHYNKGGTIEDSALYSLLKSEYLLK